MVAVKHINTNSSKSNFAEMFHKFSKFFMEYIAPARFIVEEICCKKEK